MRKPIQCTAVVPLSHGLPQPGGMATPLRAARSVPARATAPPALIRIHAIVTADSDGTHDATVNHPDGANDTHGYKYRIEREDIKKLVDGANAIFAAAGMRFVFDPVKDVEVRHDTFLNRDSLTPDSTSFDTQHVFYRSDDGSIYELWAGRDWEYKNLTQEAGAPPATGAPATYVTGASTVKHVVYRGVDGHIHELFAGDTWQHNNLTAAVNAPRAAGDPFGYTTFDFATGRLDVQHVVYRGVDGHIHELFAADSWQYNNLTAAANAPRAAGDPFGYATFDFATGRLDAKHVVYRGADGHIHELFAGDTWQHNNLTALTNAPHAGGNPFGYTTDYTDVQHVFYRGTDGNIHELFARDRWQHNNLTALAGAPKSVGDPVGYTTDDYGFGVKDDQHVLYRGADGHIHELFTVDAWQYNNLTTLANAPRAASDPTAYTDGSKQVQHIIYRDERGHLHELFSGAAWSENDLMLRTNAPSASSQPVGSFVARDGLCSLIRNRTGRAHHGQLVVYFRYGWQGSSSSVQDFVTMPSVWNPNDLSFLAHELGHYFHLDHTFSAISTVAEAAERIQTYVEQLSKQQNGGQLPASIPQHIIERGREILDGDHSTIRDTPAEFLVDREADVNVTFSTHQSMRYHIRADRQNVMNYLEKHGQPAHFSPQQMARMRDALEHRNRQHLT